jgi:ubiquinone/menaquinone biosynthesis C-methylase UbiE
MSKAYYKTKESVDEYIKLAEGYNGAELIEKLKDFLPGDSYVLELGSGPGTDWEILNKTFKVVGSDSSNEFLNRLIANIPNGEFLHLDAIALNTDKKFDGIYSNKVLHHLKDYEIKASIKRQYEILNPSGIICHSFWKGEGSEIFNGLFVNYHSDINLKKLFQGWFDILLILSYKEFENDDSVLLIGRKK